MKFVLANVLVESGVNGREYKIPHGFLFIGETLERASILYRH